MSRRTELNDLLSSLGEVIVQRRLAENLTQVELAAAVGINRTYLSDVERGRRNVTLSTLDSISAALGTSPGELLRDAEIAAQAKAARLRRRR